MLGAPLHLKTAVPVHMLWKKLFLRIESLLPGDLLSYVRRHATHDCQQCTVGKPFPIVDWLVLTDRRNRTSCSC